jgi:hypothetical protein
MLAYITILATAIAGLMHASWWAVLACGTILAIISDLDHQRWESELTGSARRLVLNSAAVISLSNGCLAGAAAYALGMLTGFVWGF